jgi:hypothetical protein
LILVQVLSLQVLSLKHGKSLFRWGGAGAPSQQRGRSAYCLLLLTLQYTKEVCSRADITALGSNPNFH